MSSLPRLDLTAGATLATLSSRLDALRGGDDAAEAVAREILSDVRMRGDAAVLERTRHFDYPDASALRVPEAAIAAAAERVQATPLWPAMEQAAARIRAFHEKQVRQSWIDASRPGETLGQLIRPVASAGIYVPGGRAAYPSTVLMAGIPAVVAGVARVALATPPGRETGLPPDATLAAAHLAGLHEVYAMGGAQAIGALAYGTESVAPVDVVAGPGNAYANAAKRLVFGRVGIDLLAGPSEVTILADHAADPEGVARELIAQTEHDPLNFGALVTTSGALADAVEEALARQLADLPRAEIVAAALERSVAVIAGSLEEAIAAVNLLAPEHLHVELRDPWAALPRLVNAGAILIGPHSAAALGDYVAGPSHTLPTAGCARYASPLCVDSFLKKQSLIALGPDAAARLSEAAATFAAFEGLEGHRRSAVFSPKTAQG